MFSSIVSYSYQHLDDIFIYLWKLNIWHLGNEQCGPLDDGSVLLFEKFAFTDSNW